MNAVSQLFFRFKAHLVILSIVVLGAVHLISLSLINFFHFMLNHKMSVIDTWILDRSYQLMIMEKLIAFLIIFFFRGTFRSKENLLGQRGVFSDEKFPHRETIVFTMTTVVLTFSMGAIQSLSASFTQVVKIIFCYFGTTLVLLLDCLVMKVFLSGKEKRDKVYDFVFMMVFFVSMFFFQDKIFRYQGDEIYYFFFFHMLAGVLFWHRKFNFFDALFFTLFGIGPIVTFIGLEPIWAGKYSPFSLDHSLGIYLPPALFILYLSLILKSKLLPGKILSE